MRRSASGPRDDLESHLREVPVGGEGPLELQLVHHHHAGAVGERVLLVALPEERLPRLLRARNVDPLPAHPRAAFHLTPPSLGRPQRKPDADEGERFVDDVVGGDEKLAAGESGVAGLPGACAVAAAAVARGEASRGSPVSVRLPGGELTLTVDAENGVRMRGPAELVFVGEL